jgi:predicted MFS family arabinose efflux permease
MLKAAAALFVFLGGFAIMVLEILGARYLAKDFGGSFYVWISQIGVILIALAVGYALGGALADRLQRAAYLAGPLVAAGLATLLLPHYAPPLIGALVMRHPADEEIPLLWQKLDPALGSALVFFLPCLVLAILPPYMIRLATRHLTQVGTISGLIYAASTLGGIAGVFVSGYLLIDHFSVPDIFRATGVLTILLAGLSVLVDRGIRSGAAAPPPGPCGER